MLWMSTISSYFLVKFIWQLCYASGMNYFLLGQRAYVYFLSETQWLLVAAAGSGRRLV